MPVVTLDKYDTARGQTKTLYNIFAQLASNNFNAKQNYC